MSWKTIVVTKSDKIFVKNNKFAYRRDENTIVLPFTDIDCVVLDNNYTLITTRLLALLSEYNIFVFVCDEKHDPRGIYLPFTTHWQPLEIWNLQMNCKLPFKKQIWTQLIRAKLFNSMQILGKLKFEEREIDKIQRLYKNIAHNDANNYEAVAARIFFRCLYGSGFVRHTDTGINKALNYGYKILASALSRSIAKYGLLNFLGINHRGKQNPFNLAYDLIEPLRPLVDYFTHLMGEEIDRELLYNQRLKLINLLQLRLKLDGEFRTVTNAIDLYVESFLTSLKTQDSTKLKIPLFIHFEKCKETEEENEW